MMMPPIRWGRCAHVYVCGTLSRLWTVGCRWSVRGRRYGCGCGGVGWGRHQNWLPTWSHKQAPPGGLPRRLVLLHILELQPVDCTAPPLSDELDRIHGIETRLYECNCDEERRTPQPSDAVNSDRPFGREAEVEPLVDDCLGRRLSCESWRGRLWEAIAL